MEQLVLGLLVAVSLVLTVQATYTLYMMLYTWDQAEVDRQYQPRGDREVPLDTFFVPQTSLAS
jgi:hypothetical protein